MLFLGFSRRSHVVEQGVATPCSTIQFFSEPPPNTLQRGTAPPLIYPRRIMLEVNDTGLLLGIDSLYTQEQINLSIHIVTTLEKCCLTIVI